MKAIQIKTGIPSNLEALVTVETRCFAAYRRSSRRSLLESLKRPTQKVWIAWACDRPHSPVVAGALTLHKRRSYVRIYSLAVLPAYRGYGVGRKLMEKALAEAKRMPEVRYVMLEADRRNRRLVQWYEAMGFEARWRLPHYYAPGRDGVRMYRMLKGSKTKCAKQEYHECT